jgi:hypothetical protein
MVISAAARGKTTSAKIVQASQVFSQAHLRAYFIGIVKLAFVTPATIRAAIPHEVLLMVGFLPLSLSQINDRNFQAHEQFVGKHRACDVYSTILADIIPILGEESIKYDC